MIKKVINKISICPVGKFYHIIFITLIQELFLMKIILTRLLFMITAILLLQTNMYAWDEQAQQDPFKRLNYRYAFDQTNIYEKHRELIEQWCCGENVFSAHQPEQAIVQPRQSGALAACSAFAKKALGSCSKLVRSFTLQDSNSTLGIKVQNSPTQYEQDCLNQLEAARRTAILAPAKESAILMALLAGASATLSLAGNGQSTNGGGWGFAVAILNSAFLLHDAVRAGYTFVNPPANPLNELEERFAKNKCFIPRVLWPIITEKFMIARSNPFEQRKNMDFLEFALGLTTYKPKPVSTIADEHSLESCIQTLFGRIDRFFADYEHINDTNLWKLKGNVYKFVHALQSPSGNYDAPRYIHLHGLGGIGKTYFVHQLCNWIEELIPGSVKFEDLVISCGQELEGDQQRPGTLLRVLRNQLMENKRGSVIFMDEATWLNNEGMISHAKRVFNGDQSRISTSYFGEGLEGAGISLKIPPMLIFVANNDEIKDQPLASRFDTIQFPMPNSKALVNHAYQVACKNELLQCTHIAPDYDIILEWIGKNEIKNFRDVAAQVVPFLLAEQIKRA